jgi:hypothetical protein
MHVQGSDFFDECITAIGKTKLSSAATESAVSEADIDAIVPVDQQQLDEEVSHLLKSYAVTPVCKTPRTRR